MSSLRNSLSPGMFCAGLFCAGLILPAGKAAAQPAIGGTVVVKNDVRSQQAGARQFKPLVTGAHVFTDDLVRTRTDSLTKIVFLDTTNMSVGPDSVVKLDKFVYNGDGTAKDVIIEASRGAFRFFSGKSPSKAYQVSTPQAVIGVRGTTYDVRVTDGVTLVVLQEGEVNVCVRNTARCRVLNQPGQSVSVDNNDIAEPLPPANKPWDFASHCAGAAASLCNKTTQFALAPLPPPRAAPPAAPAAKAKPKRKAKRKTIRPRRPAGNYDPAPPPRRRIVTRPRPVYDDPPPRRVIIDDPIYIPPRRCYPGSRHPRCRIVRPQPCFGVWRRGRCISRPIVRPEPCRGYRSRGGCVTRPIVRPPPRHGRPIYRPVRPRPDFGRPSHGRPSYRPRYRPRFEGRRSFGERPFRGGRSFGGSSRGRRSY